MYKVYSKIVRPVRLPPLPKGKYLVETAGYIPAIDQINRLINGGIALNEYRAELYDHEPGSLSEEVIDPTRTPNYDMADAYQENKKLEASLNKAKAKKEIADIQARKDKKAAEIEKIKEEAKNESGRNE